ncbi:MAG: hydrogenase expression/formation protein [Gammaproteobacteria bacterium]|nr:hydrogenase expression/formation protein [Gammaproteobacteria bacterium]
MTRLQDIPVNTEITGLDAECNMVDAVLHELKQLLDAYLSSGETGVIDIKSMPLSATDYDSLKQRLGNGEISATASLAGDTEIYETALSGVWWVVHRNIDDRVLAEQLEVGRIPAILCAHDDDIRVARERL